MSVNFSQDTKFGEKAQIEVVDGGEPGERYGARRMSRRGSVLNTSAAPPPPGTLVNSDRAYSVVAENLADFTDLHDDMRENTEKEISLGFFGGLKTYPAAACWSILLSSSIIMEGSVFTINPNPLCIRLTKVDMTLHCWALCLLSLHSTGISETDCQMVSTKSRPHGSLAS